MKVLKRVLILLNIIALLIVGYIFTVVVIMPVYQAYLPLTKLERPVEPKTNKDKKKDSAKSTNKTNSKKANVVDNSSEESEQSQDSYSEGSLRARFDSLLRKQAAFLSARYDLSKKDSIYLVVDLIDSLASLEVRGISVHKAKILKIDKSNSLKLFHAKDFALWLEYPFVLKSATATIPKIPIVVKNAPKDTLEAALQVTIPTVPKRDDVFVTLNFSKNLRLNIRQFEKNDSIGKIKMDSLYWVNKDKAFFNGLNSLTTFQYDKIAPYINIELSKTDATIIYRALPYKPEMVLRM